MLHFSILKFEYFIKSYCRELKVLVSFSEENKKISTGTASVPAAIIKMCVNGSILFFCPNFFFIPIYSKKRFLGVEVCMCLFIMQRVRKIKMALGNSSLRIKEI